jgi:hypothetical protein
MSSICIYSSMIGKIKHLKDVWKTLIQAYFQLNPEVQYAFKILMTHWILQFAWRIAVRSVLHRCASLDIHCWKLYVCLNDSVCIKVQIYLHIFVPSKIITRLFITSKSWWLIKIKKKNSLITYRFVFVNLDGIILKYIIIKLSYL